MNVLTKRGLEMERILPGLVIAGVAGLVGLTQSPQPVQEHATESGEYKHESTIIVEQSPRQHQPRGFVPAQDAVVERSE
jgi:hypothetical protein